MVSYCAQIELFVEYFKSYEGWKRICAMLFSVMMRFSLF